MNTAKHKSLEAAGWVLGNAEDFLGLTDKERLWVRLLHADKKTVGWLKMDDSHHRVIRWLIDNRMEQLYVQLADGREFFIPSDSMDFVAVSGG